MRGAGVPERRRLLAVRRFEHQLGRVQHADADERLADVADALVAAAHRRVGRLQEERLHLGVALRDLDEDLERVIRPTRRLEQRLEERRGLHPVASRDSASKDFLHLIQGFGRKRAPLERD